MGLGKYLKKAFLNHWNLLVVGAGTVFAVISGQPDVVLPILAAGELAYLGLLSTHPKFQKALDAQEAKAKRKEGAISSEEALQRITKALPPSLGQALRGTPIASERVAQDRARPAAPGRAAAAGFPSRNCSSRASIGCFGSSSACSTPSIR